MFRTVNGETVNGEKAKRLTPKTKTAVFTILWIMLVCAAMAFLALAGHIRRPRETASARTGRVKESHVSRAGPMPVRRAAVTPSAVQPLRAE